MRKEYREKQSQISKKVWTEERKEKASITSKELWNSRSYREDQSKKQSDKWKSEDYREKQLKIRSDEELRMRISNSSKIASLSDFVPILADTFHSGEVQQRRQETPPHPTIACP